MGDALRINASHSGRLSLVPYGSGRAILQHLVVSLEICRWEAENSSALPILWQDCLAEGLIQVHLPQFVRTLLPALDVESEEQVGSP